jgi:hypothetical protein
MTALICDSNRQTHPTSDAAARRRTACATRDNGDACFGTREAQGSVMPAMYDKRAETPPSVARRTVNVGA